MWVGLKPFRRLTTMVSPGTDPFGDMAGSFGGATRTGGRWMKKAVATGIGVYAGNVAAAATIADHDDKEKASSGTTTERAEARTSYAYSVPAPSSAGETPALEPAPAAVKQPSSYGGWRGQDKPETEDDVTVVGTTVAESGPPEPVEAEWVDGEEVYTVYRPADENDSSDAA
jgi:hypothetical protein